MANIYCIEYNPSTSVRHPNQPVGDDLFWANTKDMKRCTKCEMTKANTQYRKHVRYADGLLSWCNSCVSENRKLWRSNNKERNRAKNREYMTCERRKLWRKSYRKISQNVVSDRIRARLKCFIKSRGIRKKKASLELVGCTWSELREHLELQFKPGMSWKNYGAWHVDHIVPLSAFGSNLIDACHFSNLQPLWAIDNWIKSDKY